MSRRLLSAEVAARENTDHLTALVAQSRDIPADLSVDGERSAAEVDELDECLQGVRTKIG